MTTPTDNEIVTHMSLDPASSGAQIARQALRLAREGLPVPVKDEAVDLHNALGHCVGGHERIVTIRTFLAERDVERENAQGVEEGHGETSALIMARRIVVDTVVPVGSRYRTGCSVGWIESVQSGDCDSDINVRIALAAITKERLLRTDLLEALQDIVNHCTVLQPNHMPNALKNARAALAKLERKP